jgi:hypothetical protein
VTGSPKQASMEHGDGSAVLSATILAMLRGQLAAAQDALARQLAHVEEERAALAAVGERRHLGPERRIEHPPADVAPHGRR